MYKFLICLMCLGNLVVFANQANAEAEDLDFLMSTCSAFMPESQDTIFDYSDLATLKAYTPRNDSLYIFDKKSIDKDWIIVDVTREDKLIANTLKLPLHTLKLKKYLSGKKVLILGDGVNYRALEDEVTQLRGYLTKQIKIYFGGIAHWNESPQFSHKAFSISAAEYVNESKLGKWTYIYNKQDLQEVISDSKWVSIDSLGRYLLMDDQLSADVEIPNAYKYKFFLLKGGKETLAQFSIDQSRMLSASQERALRARCKGSNNA